ncbi:MAG: HU family DNA-binding protein [Acidimicrobiia bacterium]|nr:HU family DNA-binding protein [Acidimicrobiia bacterium]
MNKTELIEATAEQTGFAKNQVEATLKAITDTVVATVANKEQVTLPGFGAWKASERAARVGRNPQTGEDIKIAATTVPTFKAGSAFKEQVKAKR